MFMKISMHFILCFVIIYKKLYTYISWSFTFCNPSLRTVCETKYQDFVNKTYSCETV